MEGKPQLSEAEKLERLRLKRIAKITARSSQSFETIVSGTPKSLISTPQTQFVSTPVMQVSTPILDSPRNSEMVELPEIRRVASPDTFTSIETPIQPLEPVLIQSTPKIDHPQLSPVDSPPPTYTKHVESSIPFDLLRSIKFYILILTSLMIFFDLPILSKYKPMQIFTTIEIAFGSVLFLEFVNRISVGLGVVEVVIYFMQCFNTIRCLISDFAIFVITFGVCQELTSIIGYIKA
jgi:hypothetical protein